MQDVFYDENVESGAPRGLSGWLGAAAKWGGAAVSLILVVSIVVWAYRLGVRDARDIPVIQALDGPIRVQPDDPGGTEMAHQGLEVNEILAGNEAEVPETATLAPQTLTLAEEDLTRAELDERQSAGDEAGADPPAAEGEAPDLADQIAALVAEAEAEAGGEADPISPDDLAITPAVRPRPRPEGLEAATDAQTAPVMVETGIPGFRRVAAVAADPSEIVPGTRLVQLGAFDSETQAEDQWDRLLGAHADLLASKKRFVQRTEQNGRIFYRLRAVGFETSNDQRALCEALRARGIDCIPVTVR